MGRAKLELYGGVYTQKDALARVKSIREECLALCKSTLQIDLDHIDRLFRTQHTWEVALLPDDEAFMKSIYDRHPNITTITEGQVYRVFVPYWTAGTLPPFKIWVQYSKPDPLFGTTGHVHFAPAALDALKGSVRSKPVNTSVIAARLCRKWVRDDIVMVKSQLLRGLRVFKCPGCSAEICVQSSPGKIHVDHSKMLFTEIISEFLENTGLTAQKLAELQEDRWNTPKPDIKYKFTLFHKVKTSQFRDLVLCCETCNSARYNQRHKVNLSVLSYEDIALQALTERVQWVCAPKHFFDMKANIQWASPTVYPVVHIQKAWLQGEAVMFEATVGVNQDRDKSHWFQTEFEVTGTVMRQGPGWALRSFKRLTDGFTSRDLKYADFVRRQEESAPL